MKIPFNLNDSIGVKLDSSGIKIYKDHLNRHFGNYPDDTWVTEKDVKNKADKKGLWWFQAHEFIKIFGSWKGYYAPFDMNVILNKKISARL